MEFAAHFIKESPGVGYRNIGGALGSGLGPVMSSTTWQLGRAPPPPLNLLPLYTAAPTISPLLLNTVERAQRDAVS